MAYDHSNLWIFDTKSGEWYLIQPSEKFDEANPLGLSWPLAFNYRQYMSATTVMNKGLIVYTGGSQSVSALDVKPQQQGQKASQILLLNVERLIHKIQRQKSLASRVIQVESSEVWSQLTTGDELDLSGHSSLLLNDLNSLVILGGQHQGAVDNLKVYLLNLNEKTVSLL